MTIPEKKKKKISFSEYSTYLQCPHKWYLNYHLRMPSEENQELIFGGACHATIERLLKSPLEKKCFMAMPEQTVRDIFKSAIKKELERVKDVSFLTTFNTKNLGNIFMFQAQKLIVKLDFFNRFKDYEVADIEVKLDGMPVVSTDEVDIVYKGFVDLVLRHKKTGKLLILDWKTSSKGWDINKKMADNPNFFAQLCIYKHYYSLLKGLDFKQVDTKFYNLPRNEPEKQSGYEGMLTPDYTELFFENFRETSLKIYNHSQSLLNFDKAKFIHKKNFCHRCNFNTPELCNDVDEHQVVLIDTNGK